MEVRKKYGIPDNAKVLLYVGNISRNKNQEQLIEAFGMMSEELCENTYILFCGRNNEPGYSLDEKIAGNPYSGHLILCGNVDKKDMPAYYQQSDGAVLLSIAEGFGLSLIESMHFGKPCMTFSDLDAYDDIYDSCAMVGLQNRKDQTVADGLSELLQREWDSEAIKRYSERFESSQMADNYLSAYKQVAAQ